MNHKALRTLYRLMKNTALVLSVLGLLVFLGDFGYENPPRIQYFFNVFYFVVLLAGLLTTLARYLAGEKSMARKVLWFDVFSAAAIIGIALYHFFIGHGPSGSGVFYNDVLVKFAILLTFIREISEVKVNYYRTYLNPAQLFILSFLILIGFGTFLLMLPRATYDGISFINALFTATSAVCVTGLIVVDTGTYFTDFGQSAILLLIQAGGLGILTFASYFSYFFKGGATYENQLVLKDMTNSRNLSEAMTTIKRVIMITLSIELAGALLIYWSLDSRQFAGWGEQVYFSVFHSVSAFCNAGFSTLSAGLYDSGFRFNYLFQFWVTSIFILGGLGFPIVVNLLSYLKYRLKHLRANFTKRPLAHRPWILNLNSRISLTTSMILLLVGTLYFLVNEYNNTLAEHSPVGKLVNALFGAATPRTAGFNTLDMGSLHFSTVMLVFLLMWIGASPASTGGGIKTTTFAIATMNFISLARGRQKIELFKREISPLSVQRAFAFISLSLVVIGMAIMLISVFDEEMSLLDIAFETFSAYSTVGLSLGITAALSIQSKLVLIVTMFIGRVSMLSILIALFKKGRYSNYRYPVEEVTIN